MRYPVPQILGFLFSTALLCASVHAADKIRIGYPGPSAQFIPLQLAQSNGFLRDEGFEAEIIQMAGNVPITALINGDIDYNTVIPGGVRGAIQGLPLRVVAC